MAKYGIYAQVGDRTYLADSVAAKNKEIAKKLAESRRDRLDNQSKHERIEYPKSEEIIYFVKEIPRATSKKSISYKLPSQSQLSRDIRRR